MRVKRVKKYLQKSLLQLVSFTRKNRLLREYETEYTLVKDSKIVTEYFYKFVSRAEEVRTEKINYSKALEFRASRLINKGFYSVCA
jgi:galactose-1-phosphate uridylyltransferase